MDKQSRKAIIRGTMYKRVWLNPGDLVLCELDATGKDDQCSIVSKYTAHEANTLKNMGEIDFNLDNGSSACEFVESSNKFIKPQKEIYGLPNDSDSDDDDDDNGNNNTSLNKDDVYDDNKEYTLDDL